MRKINKLILLATIILVASCEKEEIGRDFNVELEETLVQFNSSNVLALPIAPVENVETSIEIGVSSVSNQDRQIDVTISNQSTLPSTSYTISSFIIPAGEYVGTGTITTIASPFTASETLILEVTGIDGQNGSDVLIQDTRRIVLNTFEFCPFDDGVEFLGNYQLSYSGMNSFNTFPFNDYDDNGNDLGQPIVSLTEGANPAVRNFTTQFYSEPVPGFENTWSFSLICDSIVWDLQTTGLACSTNPNPIGVGPSMTTSTYNKSDDSSFTINVVDNPLGGCNAASTNYTLTFTKI